MKTCLNCHSCEKRNTKLYCEFYEGPISKDSVTKSDCKHYDPIEPDTDVDWSYFNEDAFAFCKRGISRKIQTGLYGHIKMVHGGEPYLIDVCYECYGPDRTGYVLLVYAVRQKNYTDIASIDPHNDNGNDWLGDVETIKTASSYKSFQKRAVKEINKFLDSPIEKVTIKFLNTPIEK